jgi:hypothetical protein
MGSNGTLTVPQQCGGIHPSWSRKATIDPTGRCCHDRLNSVSSRRGPSPSGFVRQDSCRRSDQWAMRSSTRSWSPSGPECRSSSSIAGAGARRERTNAIFDYIEAFYSRQRRHSAPDYVSPASLSCRSTRRPPEFSSQRGKATPGQVTGQLNLQQIRCWITVSLAARALPCFPSH